MSPISANTRSEQEARNHRVAVLLSALTPHMATGFNAADAAELCGAFDAAVEFAACEGKSVSAAIGEFLTEDWGPALRALKKLVTPATRFVPRKLPVLPRAAAKLLQTSDENASVLELEGIAGLDPALAAQLLSAANSSLFGLRGEVCRLRDAVMRLGVPQTRKVLLAASFSSLFTTNAMRQIWEHSQEVANHAARLAGLCAADAESAYAAGLLHDIGRVAFTVFPSPMQNAQRRWLDAGFPLIYSEAMAYGSDHAAFGGELLRQWQLPEVIAQAVAQHHRPECSDSPLHAVVHLAETAGEDLWSNMRKQTALDRTGITREQLDTVLGTSSTPHIEACA